MDFESRPPSLNDIPETVMDSIAKMPSINDPEDKPAFSFIRISELLTKIKPVDWLVRGWIERDSLAMIYGEPASGKSFLAIDIAASVATGTGWHGRQVHQGSVFYICGEGHNGICRRFGAWSESRGVSLEGAPLFVSSMSAALSNEISAIEVQSAVRELSQTSVPELIVVDTLSRNFGPAEENSASDMARFIAALDNLRHPWNTTVIVIHHSGKDASRGARGSSALRAAVDSEFEVTFDGLGTVQVEPRKMKDAGLPTPIAFQLENIQLPLTDEDGNPISSAALRETEYISSPVSKQNRKCGGRNQKQAMTALHELVKEYRQNLEVSGREPNQAKVRVSDWKSRCGLPRQQFHQVQTSLAALGTIKLSNGYVEIP